MRKYLIITCLLAFFYLSSFSQTTVNDIVKRKVDSLERILPGMKGNARIDCLNKIAHGLLWLWDEDDPILFNSACSYATQAYNEAKRSDYKRGLGYAYIRMIECENGRDDDKRNASSFANEESYALQALKIGEELNDNILIGASYNHLSWIERRKGDTEKYKSYLLKAISYVEKPVKQQPPGTYNELSFTDCSDCQGNEFILAHLYLTQSAFQNVFNGARVELMEKAISYYQMAHAKSEAAGTYLDIAIVVAYFKDIETSIGYIKKAISLFHENGDEKGEFRAYIALCTSYYNFGDFENGLGYSKKSVLLAEKLARINGYSTGENLELYQAYYWVGKFYSIANDFETAFAFMRKARKYRSENQLAEWAIAMVDFHRVTGNYDSAMYYMTKAGDKALITQSSLYVSMQQYDKALETINSIIKIVTERNNLVNLGRLYTLAAKAYFGKYDYPNALTNARTAFSLTKKTSRNLELIDDYQLLSEIFNKMGKNDSAYIYLKKYTILKDSLLNMRLYIRLNDYKKEAEEERKTSQINLLNKDNQLKEQKLKQESFAKKGLIIGIMLLLLLSVFVFRSLSLKRRNENLRLQKDFELKQLENEKKQTELEMQALRAQMNPHFIFNCLSSINRFILKNEGKTASNYLTRFSRLMRMVLMNSQKPLISLDDELQMLEIYLEMERLRFKDSFDYAITFLNVVDSDNIFIPPLLLQPFCENAIWHGLMHKEGQGRLDVELTMQDNILYCIITDNGVGREKAEEMNSKTAEKEKSMGLKITTERLALLNREKGLHTFYEIEDLKDENGNAAGTKVTLKISFKESVEEVV